MFWVGLAAAANKEAFRQKQSGDSVGLSRLFLDVEAAKKGKGGFIVDSSGPLSFVFGVPACIVPQSCLRCFLGIGLEHFGKSWESVRTSFEFQSYFQLKKPEVCLDNPNAREQVQDIAKNAFKDCV